MKSNVVRKTCQYKSRLDCNRHMIFPIEQDQTFRIYSCHKEKKQLFQSLRNKYFYQINVVNKHEQCKNILYHAFMVTFVEPS